jgi:hypothetical protein
MKTSGDDCDLDMAGIVCLVTALPTTVGFITAICIGPYGWFYGCMVSMMIFYIAYITGIVLSRRKEKASHVKAA